MGWENERDRIIKRCKVIINIRHFSCYNIHESIRCDRLVFAKKLILSESSIFTDVVDIKNCIFYEKYENFLNTLRTILENFDEHNQKLQNTDLFPIIKERKKILLQSLLHIS